MILLDTWRLVILQWHIGGHQSIGEYHKHEWVGEQISFGNTLVN